MKLVGLQRIPHLIKLLLNRNATLMTHTISRWSWNVICPFVQHTFMKDISDNIAIHYNYRLISSNPAHLSIALIKIESNTDEYDELPIDKTRCLYIEYDQI